DHRRFVGEVGNRYQVIERIEVQFVETTGQHVRPQRADTERVAITHRARDPGYSGAARSPGHTLDVDRLTERLSHRLVGSERQHIGSPASCKWYHNADGPRRIIGRAGDAGPTSRGKRRGGHM